MIGYKAFDKDLKCRDFQYEIGHTYEFDGEPIACKQGFHFCKSIAETYDYYYTVSGTRICKVKATGDISTYDGIIYCTNKITIIEELIEDWKRKGNTSSSSTGYCNTGIWNTGDHNTGDCNTGNWNTGNQNTGTRNTGNFNKGNRNTGYYNIGKYNSGNYNTGDHNTGDYNIGHSNTGDWNNTIYSSGCFNTKENSIMMFDKPTDWTLDEWRYSDACLILNRIPKNAIEWIDESDMSDKEKEEYPSYKTTGGYLKVLDSESSAQDYWNGLSEDDKQKVYNLPNFDKAIFKQCTGIEV